MFGAYFGPAYYGDTYWGPGSGVAPQPQPTPGITRRKQAAERLRRIKRAVAEIEAIAEKPVTPKTAAKAEERYERIEIEALELPDLSQITYLIEAARLSLATIKAAQALAARHQRIAEEEWLLMH